MKKSNKILPLVVLFGLLAIIVFGWMNARAISDFLILRSYDPPADVVELADATTMNDKTRNVFYVNKPALQDKQNFATSCVDREETIVLGCFINNDGIFLLNVDDPRLSGIIEVTAAHEVLHALYERLSDEEKREVDAMTVRFFDTLENERIRKNIENYRKKDASVVPNELHSILGTEVRELSEELENYYKQYFNNRLEIVTLSEKYEKTFTDIENQVLEYRRQLDDLNSQISTMDEQLNSLNAQLDAERNRLDNLLAGNQVDEYNSAVPGFNNLVNQFNSLANTRQSLAKKYNNIVNLHNKLASTEAELVDALDTNSVEQAGGL